MRMRVADFIVRRLLEARVRKVFLLNGGMMMHLGDALGRMDGLGYVAQHHEQASAMAADGYCRRNGSVGVCFATSGPGATNLVTGIAGAWQDSSPVLFVTGQSKTAQTIANSGIEGLRQFGTFEVDIVSMVKSITKYAVMVTDPLTIRYHLEKALCFASSKRPGPVLLDLPIDVQGAFVETEELQAYVDEDQDPPLDYKLVIESIGLLSKARRPLILAGQGVRLSGAVEAFRDLVDRLGVPVVTTQLGKDVIYYDHPLFVGHSGPKGDRAGNLAIQTADFILSLGCSLHSQTTGWEYEQFAPGAVKVQVELDPAVLKRERVGVSLKIQADCADFIKKFNANLIDLPALQLWRSCCKDWKDRFQVMAEPHDRVDGQINYYDFVDALSCALGMNDCVVTDAGSAFYVLGQALRLKPSQRFFSSGSLGAMGFALPAANGVASAGLPGNVVCVTGDGSLMTNLHDLATMKRYGLNVKLFVLNNNGYVSIRNTQTEFFDGYYVGADVDSGVFIPPINLLANCFGLPYKKCTARDLLKQEILNVLAIDGPVIFEVRAMSNQRIIPSVSSTRSEGGILTSAPLHDMSPRLPEDAIKKEMSRAMTI